MTLHVDNIWHNYLVFYEKKKFYTLSSYAKYYYFWQPAEAK